MKKKRKIKKKTILYLLLIIIVLVASIILRFLPTDNNKNKVIVDDTLNKEQLEILVTENYYATVKVVEDTDLYLKKDNKINKIGIIAKDIELSLDELNFADDEVYFKIKDTDYYVHYSKVSKLEELNINDKYKNYIPFNEDVVTKESFKLYTGDGVSYTINESLTFDVIVKSDDSYSVEFNNALYEIKKEDIEKLIDSDNSKESVVSSIPVLNYHFFYDKTKETCNESICLELNRLDSHFKYLKDNGYYTLTMNDLDLWMDKKINLPKKSVLITVDDGAMGTDTHLIHKLEEYDLQGTLFLITQWWPKSKYLSPNLEVQSHGNDIHYENHCSGVSRGARGLCYTKAQLIEDFNKSKEKLDNDTIAFCFPFYLYNNNMLEALKETGFKLGFIGGNKKVTQNTNKLLIPRYVIYNSTDVNSLKNMLG